MATSSLDLLLPRLRALRERHRLTQEQFAEIAGLGYKYYQQIEGGRKRDLRLSTLERLATAYGTSHRVRAPPLPRRTPGPGQLGSPAAAAAGPASGHAAATRCRGCTGNGEVESKDWQVPDAVKEQLQSEADDNLEASIADFEP